MANEIIIDLEDRNEEIEIGSDIKTVTVSNYELLSNKPQINSVELSGNKTLNELGIQAKEDGKGLSTNDFTNEYKNQLDNLDVPTKTSDLVNDSGFISTETDPTVPNYVKNIKEQDINNWNNKSDFSGDYNDLTNKPTIPDVSNFITKDVNNLTNYELKTNTGTNLELSINSSTYVMTLNLKNSAGTTLSTGTVDLPLESVVVSGSYDSTNKKVVLTLQNGSTIEFSVADLVSGLQNEITSSNKLSSDLVDDTNSINKFFSGNYNDLTNKPTIPTVPTNVSAFTNDAGYTTNIGTITEITMNGNSKGTSGVVDLGTVITEHQDISGKQDLLVSGTNIKTINNQSILGSGNITIESGGGISLPANAGTHNSIYRGNDITDLWYNGTLSQQIANGTFDDIFVGDYIIGQNSGLKYLVADINYRLYTGDVGQELTTNHVLMIPEKSMGNGAMNSTSSTTNAYVGSAMYTTNLAPHRNTIISDFGSNHILTHKNYFADRTTNGYETAGGWYNSTVDLMNERMLYGIETYHNNAGAGKTDTLKAVSDKTQLNIFRHRADLIVAFDSNNERVNTWLRDVSTSANFCFAQKTGVANAFIATNTFGIRPAFLIY